MFAFLFLLNVVVAAPHPAKLEIVKESDPFAYEGKNRLGLYFKLEPGWHIYWKNPGDSGTAPTVEVLKGSTDVVVEPLEFPSPKTIQVGPLTNYGYENEVLLILPFELQTDRDQARLSMKVDWLVCKEICLPGSKTFHLSLAFARKKGGAQTGLFQKLQTSFPFAPTAEMSAARAEIKGDQLHLLWKSAPGEFYFYSEEPTLVEHSSVQTNLQEGETHRLIVPLSPQREAALPRSVSGLLQDSRNGTTFSVTIPASQAPWISSLLWMMLLAFIGGILLNLMPCVFPVLSIKVLGFLEHGRKSSRQARLHGWLFTTGVLVSFWVLVAALLFLKAFGQQVGWGFQLQSPTFVLGITLLLTLMAMNFFGVFDLGYRLTGVGQKLTLKEGHVGTFFSGALATVVATPCTAPFMGSAVGFALSQGFLEIFFVFTSLAFGMACPYLLLSYFPKGLNFLPKPGPWMETLKKLMGFPLLGTVAWLLWVLDQQIGADGVLNVYFSLLFACLAAFIWPSSVKKTRKTVYLFVLLSAIFSFWFAERALKETVKSTVTVENDKVRWESFSPEKIEGLQKEGKTFFVDFTAAWCVSCQVNEKLVFGSREVLEEIRRKKLILLKADWTNGDPVITQFLANYKRSGIPFYLMYARTFNSNPQILPEVLTPEIFLKYLKEAPSNE